MSTTGQASGGRPVWERGRLGRLAGGLRDYLQEEVAAQRALLRERRALYTPQRKPVAPEGRVVIVVDDGSATGATMLAALRAMCCTL